MEYFLIAKVEQSYGKNGFVKLRSFSNFPQMYVNLKRFYLDFWGDKKLFIIEDVKQSGGGVVVKFRKFDTLRDVQVLIGRDIYVDEKDRLELSDNQYFFHELIGSEVIVENESIGIISDVIKGKANDVLVIGKNKNDEKLLPFVLNFIEKFDVAEKKLILNISKDFLEDDED